MIVVVWGENFVYVHGSVDVESIAGIVLNRLLYANFVALLTVYVAKSRDIYRRLLTRLPLWR